MTFATTTRSLSDLPGVGSLVREWRQQRRLSQMDLALDAGISPRHLSFVETGRARPSAEVLLALAQRLDVPLRTRNTWLLAAGYAPRFTEQPLTSGRMAQVHAALTRLLDAHNPYPGVALDRHWNLVLANAAARKVLALLPDFLQAGPVNLFRISLHPQGVAALTQNFAEWGSYLLQELHKLAQHGRDDAVAALQQEVLAYPNVQALRQTGAPAAGGAPTLLVPCVLSLGGKTLSFFTTLSTFGTPRDITLDELCVELFYPADAATEAALQAPPHA